jgi:hypothetical protein
MNSIRCYGLSGLMFLTVLILVAGEALLPISWQSSLTTSARVQL